MTFFERTRFGNPGSPAWHRPSVRKILADFSPNSDCHILDVGGTPKSFKRLAAKENKRVSLVNPDLKTKAEYKNIFDINEERNAFDLITFFGTLCRLEISEAHLIVKKAHKLLRTGGYILISDPKRSGFISKIELMIPHPGHFTCHTPESAQKILYQNGFKAIRLESDIGKKRLLTSYFTLIGVK